MSEEGSFRYKAFNIVIQTDFKISGLQTSSLKPQVLIRNNPQLKRELNYGKRLQKLSLSNARIENEQLVAKIDKDIAEYFFFSDHEDHVKQTKIMHQIMPSILFMNDIFVIHGAAFEINEKAVIIAGPSSYGKSETINQLSRNYKVLSDDIVGIKIQNNQPFVLPGLPFTALSSSKSSLPLADKRNRYFNLIPSDRTAYSERIISQIIILDWGSSYKMEKLTQKIAFLKLMENTFRPLPSNSCKRSEINYLKNFSNILKKSDQFLFTRIKGNIEESTKQLIKNIC